MEHILIAAFDRYEEARQARQELLDLGISSGDIQLSAARNPDMLDSSQTEVASGEREGQEDTSVSEQVASFFRSLLGEDESKGYHDRYPEAIRRGSTVLTVTLADDSRVSLAEGIMEHNGAIDIDERSASWSDGSEQPETASTSALTTGYPDATSISAGVTETDSVTAPGGTEGDDAAIPGRAENDRAAGRDNTAGRVRIISR